MGLGNKNETFLPEITQEVTESEYRKVSLDSSSSIKIFADDRLKYKKKYIDNQEVKDKDNLSVTIGRLVETKLFEPELLEKKFAIQSYDKRPSDGTKMLDFVEELFKLMVADAEANNGVCQKKLEEQAPIAMKAAGYAERTKLETLLKQFEKEGSEYLDSLLDSIGKQVITVNELETAQRVADQLANKFPNLVRPNSEDFIALNQVKIWEGLELEGVGLKGMLDHVELEFNHKEKLCYITPFDLKCSYACETFFWGYYLERKSYFQAYIYNRLIHTRQFKLIVKDLIPKGYKVIIRNFTFIIGDSTGRYEPLSFIFDKQAEEDAWLGFKIGNRPHKGLKETLQELKWAKETGIWNISKKNYERNGIVNLSECYG